MKRVFKISGNRDVCIETPYALPCWAEIFTIGDIKAYQEKFGDAEDTDPDAAVPYGCGCTKFIVNEKLKEKAMELYNLTEEDYNKICTVLQDILYVGDCGWCS